jgi:hypothetical protein
MGQRDLESAGIYMEQGASIKTVSIGGNVVGRDLTIGADAAVDERQRLLAEIEDLRAQVAALAEANPGLRDDAHDELSKAKTAGEQGDTNRLVEKLEAARGYLERLGQDLPSALALAGTVATLVQRVAGLG